MQLLGRQMDDRSIKTGTIPFSPPLTPYQTHDFKTSQIQNPSQENLAPLQTSQMEGGKDQNKGTKSTSAATQQPARGTTTPTTNLHAIIPLEFLEQMFKALRPDMDVSQTLAYLAQTTQSSTSTVDPATQTTPPQPMPSTTVELAEDERRSPNEGKKELVEEEETPQGSIQPRDEVLEILEVGEGGATMGEARGITEVTVGEAGQTELIETVTEGVSNPDQCNPEEEGVIPLQMEDFPGHTASPLPVLTPPTEMSLPEEEVLLLGGPSHPVELQIVDPSYDSEAGKEEQRRKKKRKEKMLAQPKAKRDKSQRKGENEEPEEEM